MTALVDASRATPPHDAAVFQHCGGATGRVLTGDRLCAPPSIANMMAVRASGERMRRKAHGSHAQVLAALDPHTRGFYVNDIAREVTAAEIHSNYRGNYPRLVEMKKQDDPQNCSG